MSTTEWIRPLENILDCPVRIVMFTSTQWNEKMNTADAVWIGDQTQSNGIEGQRAEENGITRIVVDSSESTMQVIEIDKPSLSTSEKDLISWTLQLNKINIANTARETYPESERNAIKLGKWIQDQLESDDPAYTLPDHLTYENRLFNEMIPFLLVTEHSNSKQAIYAELEKLLKSFLSEDVLLIPLKSREWLIWGPTTLLRDDSDPYEEHEEETIEESLTSICLGLNEMLVSEWIGECHLAVAYPMQPARGMVETTLLLRETINLGRSFHVGTHIHLPWMLQLERLLNAIPESQRAKYLEQLVKRADIFIDSEFLNTVETFFELDCNVSDTAKKLYIHRNTLLYRLDKLKQETGLDVRKFHDAVLVKIILLLYKVTKRN